MSIYRAWAVQAKHSHVDTPFSMLMFFSLHSNLASYVSGYDVRIARVFAELSSAFDRSVGWCMVTSDSALESQELLRRTEDRRSTEHGVEGS